MLVAHPGDSLLWRTSRDLKPLGWILTARSLARQLLGTESADLVPYRVLYEVYMASQMWRERRQSFLTVVGRKCVGCGSTDEIEVHHRSYERFTHELDEDLRSVCSTCHLWIHHYERTNRISLAAATDMVLSQPRMVKSRRRKPPPIGREMSSADKVFSFYGSARRSQRARDKSPEYRRKINGL